jgi:hypothetical protein
MFLLGTTAMMMMMMMVMMMMIAAAVMSATARKAPLQSDASFELLQFCFLSVFYVLD